MPILMKPLKTFEIVIINFYVRNSFVYVIKVKKRLEDIPSIAFFFIHYFSILQWISSWPSDGLIIDYSLNCQMGMKQLYHSIIKS